MLIIEVFLPIHRRRHRAPVFADMNLSVWRREAFSKEGKEASTDSLHINCCLEEKEEYMTFFVSHQVTWLNCSNTINNCNFNIHDHTNICIWKQMNILIITEPEKSEWWLALQRPWCVFHSQITRFFPSSKIRIACLVPCLHKYVN